MRFVPLKSEEQKAVLMLHRSRELLVRQHTMPVNALRVHLRPRAVGCAIFR
jgi:transposase